MEKAKAIATLHSIGIPLAPIQSAADDLERGMLVEQEWDADACAMLCLRLLAPTLPLEEFLLHVAWASLNGIAVEEIGASWRAQGDAARSTPYSRQWPDAPLLVSALATHLRCAASGWASQANYPEIVSVSLHECTGARYGELALRFTPPTTFAPVTSSLIYGNQLPWADRWAGAKQTMQGFALWGFVVELKRDNAPNHEPSHSTGYFDEMIAAATMAANEQPRTLH
jgi:hypothetical protein